MKCPRELIVAPKTSNESKRHPDTSREIHTHLVDRTAAALGRAGCVRVSAHPPRTSRCLCAQAAPAEADAHLTVVALEPVSAVVDVAVAAAAHVVDVPDGPCSTAAPQSARGDARSCDLVPAERQNWHCQPTTAEAIARIHLCCRAGLHCAEG